MSFNTPAALYRWYYEHLYVHVAQVRAKGFVCKNWLEKKGGWAEDFRSLASNMQFTLKGGRTLLRLGKELMDKAKWEYKEREFPPEPIYANSVALSQPLCEGCQRLPFIKIDFLNMEEKEAFDAVYWGYINDGRTALAYMRYVQQLIDEHNWEHNLPIDTMEFHVNDVQSRIQWGWRCAESNYLGGLTTHNIKHDRDELEIKAKRFVRAIARELTPSKNFCNACRANIIDI